MNVSGRATEDEMILAFLSAEIDAPRWRERYRDAGLRPGDAGPDADLTDPDQNERRRHALAMGRGYGRNEFLFRGLPEEVEWFRATVTAEELGDFRLLNYRTFLEITGGSRRVADGAQLAGTVETGEELSARVLDVAQAVGRGERYPPLIAISTSIDSTPVILEGNTRATAYLRELEPEEVVEVITGVSPTADRMHFF